MKRLTDEELIDAERMLASGGSHVPTATTGRYVVSGTVINRMIEEIRAFRDLESQVKKQAMEFASSFSEKRAIDVYVEILHLIRNGREG